MKVRSSVAVGFLSLFVLACSAGDAPGGEARGPAGPGRTGALPRLAFFMNPGGVPCQIQDQVLREMAPELSGRAQLVVYRTTDPAHLAEFGRYGIRSLPALILTDASGREVRRATPGIQSAEQIRLLVGP